jgi:hypothetical protein
LSEEKKAAREWDKYRIKKIDGKEITLYLKGTYEFQSIADEEKIERLPL